MDSVAEFAISPCSKKRLVTTATHSLALLGLDLGSTSGISLPWGLDLSSLRGNIHDRALAGGLMTLVNKL